MTSESDGHDGSPKEPTPPEANRLRNYGELLVDASALIEMIQHYEVATHITYTLLYPMSPDLPTAFPDAVLENFAEYPQSIEISGGFLKPPTGDDEPELAEKADERVTARTLSVELLFSDYILKIIREDTTKPHQEDEDLILNTMRFEPEKTLNEELRGNSEELFATREKLIPAVSQKQLNTLLLSLALPENFNALDGNLDDKNLLDDDSFLWLMESLRHQVKSLPQKEARIQTSGMYRFNNSDSGLTFKSDNGKEDFTFMHTDSVRDVTTIVRTDTQYGLTLRFFVYTDGVELEFSPSTDDLQQFKAYVTAEMEAISSTGKDEEGEQLHSELPVDTTMEAVEIGLYAIESQKKSDIMDAGLSLIIDEDEWLRGPNPESESDTDD